MKTKLIHFGEGTRFGVYAVTVLGTPLVAYANSKGWIGQDEVQLWAAEVAAAGTLAGVHVRSVVRRAQPPGSSTAAAVRAGARQGAAAAKKSSAR